MEKKSFKERTGQAMEELGKTVEQLRYQLEQTAEEAKAAFEKEKKTVVQWVDKIKEKVEELEEVGEEKAKDLRMRLEELRVQAALGKAETEEAFEQQQKQLRRKMRRLKSTLLPLEKDSQAQAKELSGKAGRALDQFQTRFDLFRWQLLEGKEGLAEFWKEKKADIAAGLNKLTTKLEEASGDASEKWQQLSGSIADNWQQLKSTLAGRSEATYFSDLHFDHRKWNSEIEFWEDELEYFQNQLSEVIHQQPGQEVLVKVEHFQNAFRVHWDQLDGLSNDIQRHEIRLAQIAREDPQQTDDATFADHGELRKKMEMQRKLFRELKEEYYGFLSQRRKAGK